MNPTTAADAATRTPGTSSTSRTSLPHVSQRLGATTLPQFQPPAEEDVHMSPPQAAGAPTLGHLHRPEPYPTLPNKPRNIAGAVVAPARSKLAPNNYHTTNMLNDAGDEYIQTETDELGERKVLSNGQLLGGREYRIRTFNVPNRADELFMLATECSRVLGYRDSYTLFNRNKSLYQIIANQVVKDDLVTQEILPYSYKSRQIAIVTARSIFQQFGSRVIVNGRRVRDDYWESRARKKVLTESGLPHEERPAFLPTAVAAATEAATEAASGPALDVAASAVLSGYSGHSYHVWPTLDPDNRSRAPGPTNPQGPYAVVSDSSTILERQTQQERPFSCNLCSQSFDRNHDLKRHKRIHLAVKPYPCGSCDKAFSRRDALKRHRLVKHDYPISELNSGEIRKGDTSILADRTARDTNVQDPVCSLHTPSSSLSHIQKVWGGLPDSPLSFEEPTVLSLPLLPSAPPLPLPTKAEVPLTDSGYGSTAGIPPHVHVIGGHEHDEDRQTEYSDATTVAETHARNYINELCHDILEKLGPHTRLSVEDMSLLPALIKALAIKIVSHEPSQVNRDIMYFIHKHHKELTQQLNDLLSQDRDDKPPDRVQDTGDGMQIWEKLDLWHSAIRADSPPEGGSDELFEGVGDEDGELTMPLSTYSQIVLNSPAYGWFISRLKTECSQPSIARRHIASLILSRFPTARISKHRLPDKHRASFLLSWQSIADQARLRCARVKSSLEPGAILPSMATLTSSSDNEMQATIAGDYLHETWPCLGRKLLYVVSLTVNGGPGTSTSGTLADETFVRVECGPADLVVDVTGTAYSIAECGEQLSWLTCAMRALPTNLPVYTTPIVSSLPDVTNSQGVSSASFRIDVREDVIPYSQLQERCWYRAVGHPLLPVIVRGFPTRRRPEGCPGLELSYLTLIAAFGKIPHRAPFRLERGPVCLQLVDRIGRDVFCWHNKNLPGDRERCRGGYPQALRHPTFDITISDLRSGRHIICPCVDTQSDVAEEDGDGESTSTTDESLSLGLVSDASDSQTTEDPAETTPAYDLFKRVLRRLIVEFQGGSNNSTGTGPSSTNTAAKGTGPLDTAQSSSATPALCRGKKRSRGASGGKGDDDEEGPPNKKTNTGGSPCSSRSALLACPFWKLDPNTHWKCYAKRLTAISYVKQHLNRNHTPAYYCQRCFTIFQQADTYDDHVTATPPCMRGPSTRLEGISPAQGKRLRRRVEGSVEDQWFAIWDIVFPQDPRPSLVYMDYDQSEDFASFQEFVRRRGVPIVRDELETSGMVSVSGGSEGQPLDSAIERALEGLFERFRSGRLSYSVSSRAPQTAGQLIGGSTENGAVVASSITDSGIGISSAFSSGGSGASDEIPRQPLATNSSSTPDPLNSGQIQGPVFITGLGTTEHGYGGLPGEDGDAGFTDDLVGVPGEDEFTWDDFMMECYK